MNIEHIEYLSVYRYEIFSSVKIFSVNFYFCCSLSGSVFHPEFCFSDKAGRPLPGETSK